MQYPKIHSLWKRQGWYFEEGKKHNPEYQVGRQSFIVGDYALDEFSNIKRWQVQEKIDGTNIRAHWNLLGVEFAGRTNDAMIHKDLERYLKSHLTYEKIEAALTPQEGTIPDIWLFGEGYGPKIQKGGGNYRKDIGFILFDIWINGWWLEQESVKEIAAKLEVPYAPIIGIMTEEEIVDYVKSQPLSLCSITPQTMEGIIARPEKLLLKRNGEPLVFKLKCKEFK